MKTSARKLTQLAAQPRTAGAAISRMPRKVREEVSNAMEDGADWRKISALCNGHGHSGVTAQNVTNYRKGAHQEWLARQLRLEAIRRDSEMTLAVMEHYVENGGSPAEAGLLAAAELMSGAISGLGPEMLAQLIADDPKAVLGITRELSRVAELLEKKKAVKLAAPATPADGKPTLTPEQRAAAMKEIFGLPT